MIRRALLVAAFCGSSSAGAALSERDLARAVAKPPAGATLPASLPFIDQRGHRTTLGQIAGGRPLVLIFADFTCRHVCAPALVMAENALAATELKPTRDYRLVVVGMDPRDTPADARHLGESAAAQPENASGRTLLVGDAATVRAATRALGYGYVYDASSDQFAHDAAVYVFGPDGRLSAMLPELALQPTALKAALTGGRPVEQSFGARVARLCYGFAAAHGRFAGAVVSALQGISLLLLCAAGVFAWRARRA